MTDELWKPIAGYEKEYLISTSGKVFSMKTSKIIKYDKTAKGYPRVELWHNNQRKRVCIHRLVADTFIPNPENKTQINHKDGNKNNYSIENLEWCVASEKRLIKNER